MHIDIGAVVQWFFEVVPWLKAFNNWVQSGLTTVKLVQDVAIKPSQELLQSKDDDDKHIAEKARANAELIRSYVGIGWIEFAVWFTKAIILSLPCLLTFHAILRMIERSSAAKQTAQQKER